MQKEERRRREERKEEEEEEESISAAISPSLLSPAAEREKGILFKEIVALKKWERRTCVFLRSFFSLSTMSGSFFFAEKLFYLREKLRTMRPVTEVAFFNFLDYASHLERHKCPFLQLDNAILLKSALHMGGGSKQPVVTAAAAAGHASKSQVWVRL